GGCSVRFGAPRNNCRATPIRCWRTTAADPRRRNTPAAASTATGRARSIPMTAIRRRIEPQSGVGFELRAGERLRVIDPLGEQVSDLTAFNLDGHREWLSSGRTFDYNNTVYLTAGHRLYSNRSRVMMTIVEDTVGRHDFLY